MNLSEILSQIDAVEQHPDWAVTGKDIAETISTVRTTTATYAEPLPLDFDLLDPYVVVDHVAHVPESIVQGFRTLDEVEEAILDSFLNAFCSNCFVFADGQLTKFEIVYRDSSGSEQTFDKLAQLNSGNFGGEYPHARVRWTDNLGDGLTQPGP